MFFLIALFAFNFLNFHGLHGCVQRLYLCIYTWVGVSSIACVGSMDV